MNSDTDSSSKRFCLRWNNYQTNLTNVFDQLLKSETFVDVTLVCDDSSIKAHKIVLSACSPFFQSLFHDNPCHHPTIVLCDFKWVELKALVDFMYKGEVKVAEKDIGPLLKLAESLKICGLVDLQANLRNNDGHRLNGGLVNKQQNSDGTNMECNESQVTCDQTVPMVKLEKDLKLASENRKRSYEITEHTNDLASGIVLINFIKSDNNESYLC